MSDYYKTTELIELSASLKVIAASLGYVLSKSSDMESTEGLADILNILHNKAREVDRKIANTQIRKK